MSSYDTTTSFGVVSRGPNASTGGKLMVDGYRYPEGSCGRRERQFSIAMTEYAYLGHVQSASDSGSLYKRVKPSQAVLDAQRPGIIAEHQAMIETVKENIEIYNAKPDDLMISQYKKAIANHEKAIEFLEASAAPVAKPVLKLAM